MKTTQEIENTGATPEQLLRIIDAQLAAQRSQRGKANRNRATILVVGLLFVVMAAGAALLILDQMLSDLRHNDPAESLTVSSPAGMF